MVRGKIEAKFSIVRKMSENHADKKFKKKKEGKIESITCIQTGIKKLLSDN